MKAFSFDMKMALQESVLTTGESPEEDGIGNAIVKV
jgi:hypothetical protein